MIGITIGDPSGIGPEVTLKALAKELPEDNERYLLFGNFEFLTSLNEQLGTKIPLHKEQPGSNNRVEVCNPIQNRTELVPSQGSRAAAEAAIDCLKEAGQRCLQNQIAAMVTAPLNKEAVIRTGRKFVGQTEYLSDLAGTSETAMMLMGADEQNRWLRVTLVTTHLPLKSVASAITREKVSLAIDLADKAGKALKLPKQRIAVCGLNPHAGEGGQLGREEIDVVIPAVMDAQSRGLDVTGPLAADTLFYYAYRGHFDLVVAMYHDQGLAPLKMIGFENGINWTLGLPFIRTSPDHGTAYDIAGKGVANCSSMVEAIRLAKTLARK